MQKAVIYRLENYISWKVTDGVVEKLWLVGSTSEFGGIKKNCRQFVVITFERDDPLALIAATKTCNFVDDNILHTFILLEIVFQSWWTHVVGDISFIDIRTIKFETKSSIDEWRMFDSLSLCKFSLIAVVSQYKFLCLASWRTHKIQWYIILYPHCFGEVWCIGAWRIVHGLDYRWNIWLIAIELIYSIKKLGLRASVSDIDCPVIAYFKCSIVNPNNLQVNCSACASHHIKSHHFGLNSSVKGYLCYWIDLVFQISLFVWYFHTNLELSFIDIT